MKLVFWAILFVHLLPLKAGSPHPLQRAFLMDAALLDRENSDGRKEDRREKWKKTKRRWRPGETDDDKLEASVEFHLTK